MTIFLKSLKIKKKNTIASKGKERTGYKATQEEGRVGETEHGMYMWQEKDTGGNIFLGSKWCF